ncbi:MAG: zinc ABC transporter substrate-binding protein, partial [Actinomycetota bacterium]
TTGMIGDAALNVGGDRVEVETLMGAGTDPHLYKATENDVVAIGTADIVFFNGLHLEAAMGEVLERTTTTITVPVGSNIPEELLERPAAFEGQYDPHVWFDVKMWSYAVGAVRDALMELDPAHASTYEDNAEEYLAELLQLDAYIQEQADRISPDKRVLITAHDAFNYFGRAYGFEVRGLQGISTASEAGTADVSDLSAFIAERRIPAIFIESSVPVRTIEAVQAAVRARGFDVVIGGELFSDAMGDEGTVEGTYVGMVTHNVDVIVAALLEQP